MTTHSILPPSSAKAWTACTASIKYCLDNADRIPPDRGSIYAEEGTKAHDFAQKILEGKMTEDDLPEDFKQVKEYTDICKALTNRWSGTSFVEAKTSLFYYPSQNGTCDYALVSDHGVFIRDLKWGAGVPVSAEGNIQLAIYSQSMIAELQMLFDLHDDLPVELGIVQPRFAGEETHKIWTTTVGELREFCAPVQAAAEEILKGLEDPDYAANLVFAPSDDNCRWCKAKAICQARATQAFEGVSVCTDLLAGFDTEDPDNVHLPVIGALTDQQIVAVVRRGKDLKAFVASCEEYLTNRAVTGSALEGTKLVEGRQGNRAWSDEAEAARIMVKELGMGDRAVFDLKVKSPTKITDLLKKDKASLALLEPLIVRSPGRPVLAFSEDPRPAITPPAGGFDSLEDSE